MKKSILSIVMLLVVATATNAAPRFGIIGEQENGLGAFITDDMYNAQVSFSNSTNDATAKTEGTKITVGANYKIALDSVTALTAGVNYATTSGKVNSVDIETNTTIALSAGFERALSSNIVLTTEADIYSTNTQKYKANAFGLPTSDEKTTALFSNGRVGVAYLF